MNDEKLNKILVKLFDSGFSFEVISDKLGLPLDETISRIMANIILEGAEKEGII